MAAWRAASGKWPKLEETYCFMPCGFNPDGGFVKAYGNASKHPAKAGNEEWEEGKVFLLVNVLVLLA